MQPVFAATRGGLAAAAEALAAVPAPRIGLITGFFVPGAEVPAPETDGPAGAALLCRGFADAGLICRVATDEACAGATRIALHAAGAASVPLDALAPAQDPAALCGAWRAAGIDWAIAIERCGPSADGRPRNMRGLDISLHVAPLHGLFTDGPWRTIAIGDGGNELGMGGLPPRLVADHVPLGDTIACVTPAEVLIAAGISHWGAYALLAGLALLRPDWRCAMRRPLDPVLDEAVVRAMVRDGPAVDGVSLRRAATIDALPMPAHHAVLEAVLAAADA